MAKEEDKAPPEWVRFGSLLLSCILAMGTKESVPTITNRADVFVKYIRKG